MMLRFAFLSFLVALSSAIQAQPITEADLLKHIKILASDEFEGREPGTVGENKTINYIAAQWQQAGLVPATKNDSWYAPVTLIERRPTSQTIGLVVAKNNRTKKINVDDRHFRLRGSKKNSALANSQMVFAGYANQDDDLLKSAVDGKLAVILFTPPKDVDDFPDYRARKQALIKAGAWGVITVIEGKKRWRGSARRFQRGSTTLQGDIHHANIEGLISAGQLNKIARKAKLKFNDLKRDAATDGFAPIALPIFADITVDTDTREYISHNVIGRLAGNDPEAGAILYLGHWDHFGRCETKDENNPDKDLICNGAVDNASGMALLIEAAKELGKTKLDRDVYFLGTTAEEKGLLGARAFVADSAFDLKRLKAVFNADTVALSPKGDLIAVVGRGETDLDGELEAVAKQEGREIDKTDKANAFLKRQDGFVFLEQDIPAFMITSAFSDQERLDAYLAGRYHDASDEADDGLILGGAAADANFHVALGRYFGNIATFPQKASGE